MEVLTSSMDFLLLGGVGLLHHARHVPVLAVHGLGRSRLDSRPLPSAGLRPASSARCGADQRGQGLGAEQWRVAREDDHVLHLVVISRRASPSTRRPACRRSRSGPAARRIRSPWSAARTLDQGLGHPLGPGAPPRPRPGVRSTSAIGIEHVQDHRAPTQEVQRLGALGAHPRPLPGGERRRRKGGARASPHVLIPAEDARRAYGTLVGVPGMEPYDEFGLFHENAAEYGLPYDGPPEVRRVDVAVSPGRAVSSLRWGSGSARAGSHPRRRAERPHLGHRSPGPRAAAAGGRPARPRPLRRGARGLHLDRLQRARPGGGGG